MANERLAQAIRDFDEARKHHDLFVSRCERQYRAYRGILERRSDAAQWTTKLHPPLILPVVEAMVANLLDPTPKFRIRPRPRLEQRDPAVFEQQLASAKTLEQLLAYQLDLDDFARKQVEFVTQGIIHDFTVGKCYWKTERGEVSTLERRSLLPWLQSPGFLQEVRSKALLRDDPTFEVVDVRDFLWHEAARDLQSAKYVIHRVWKTFDELKELEALGVYSNVDALKESREFAGEVLAPREQELFSQDRTKDQIEVLEHWGEKGVVTVANRKVELRSQERNPFDHGRRPFVAASATPDMFRVPGISLIERMDQLQEMLWTLQNQRLSGLLLLNNPVVKFRSDVDDPDKFAFETGARWEVDAMDQVEVIFPDAAQSVNMSMPAEQTLRGDLQNTTSGMPFVAGADSNSVDQETATGVSIITSLAQKVLALRKQQFSWAFKELGQQWVALDQQFIREERLIEVVGQDGDPGYLLVDPTEIQGRFDFTVEMASESLIRQERLAESQARLQIAAQTAPAFFANGTPLNLVAFMEDVLEAANIMHTAKYFTTQQAPPPQLAGAAQPEQGIPDAGVTSPLAYGPGSPSSQASLSPEVFLQRAGALSGGVSNT